MASARTTGIDFDRLYIVAKDATALNGVNSSRLFQLLDISEAVIAAPTRSKCRLGSKSPIVTDEVARSRKPLVMTSPGKRASFEPLRLVWAHWRDTANSRIISSAQ